MTISKNKVSTRSRSRAVTGHTRRRGVAQGEERFVSRNPDETRAFASALANRLEPGAVLALHGELGSGKTCFVQGLAEGLGVVQAVTSPTFTIINEYAGRVPLYHIDLYRVGECGEVAGLGIEEYLDAEGITAIEWAERAETLLPPRTIHFYFQTLARKNSRRIRILKPNRHISRQASGCL